MAAREKEKNYSEVTKPVGTTEIKAKVDMMYPFRLVGFDGNYAKSGSPVLGVLDIETPAGENAKVITKGVAFIEAGEAMPQGAPIQSDDIGRAIRANSGPVIGYILDSTESPGELVRAKIA